MSDQECDVLERLAGMDARIITVGDLAKLREDARAVLAAREEPPTGILIEVEQLDTAGLVRVQLSLDDNPHLLSPSTAQELGGRLIAAARDVAGEDTERPERREADPITDDEIAQGRGAFRIADSAAQERTAERLRHARGSIRAAFDGLGLGWDYEDVWDYCNGSVVFRTMRQDERAKVAGMVMGFAVVAIEQSRDTEREHEG